jgi:tetratricopeptide (TPR) repeat protein
MTERQRAPYLKVLVSHASEEQTLAEAWKSLISTISSRAIEVWFSSDVTPEGGMSLGHQWREYLYTKLAECDFVIAIQTPSSAGRPWIIWECGVASGVEQIRGVVPIVFSMGRGDLSNPLNTYQAYQGQNREQVKEVCARLLQELGLDAADELYEFAINAYMEKVELHQPRAAVRSEQMALWLARFEELIRSGRVGEVPAKRQAMYTSFGDSFEPIDAALHEMLSRVLVFENREFEAAITEVDYALQIVGHDIDLLHRKALALAEMQNLSAAQDTVNELLSNHPELQMNAELASLEGRIARERWQLTSDASNLDDAYYAYFRAYQADPTQYFPGINAGSLALSRKDEQKAEEILADVLDRCHILQKHTPISYWVDFSAAEAHIGLGEVDEAMADYRRGLTRIPPPPARDKSSALKGAGRMVQAKGLDSEVTEEIQRILT